MTFDENGFTTEAGYVDQYFYSTETGEFLEHLYGWLPPGVSMPPNATVVAPDSNTPAGHVQVWDGSKWYAVEDHRGATVYRIVDKMIGEWVVLGPVNDGVWTLLVPAAYTDEWDGEKWVHNQSAVDDQTRAANTKIKTELTEEANLQIAILTDATDPDIMGDDIDQVDVANLKLWKAYRVKLSRVTDMLNPVWPAKPE